MAAVEEEETNERSYRPCNGLRTELLNCLKESDCFKKVKHSSTVHIHKIFLQILQKSEIIMQ